MTVDAAETIVRLTREIERLEKWGLELQRACNSAAVKTAQAYESARKLKLEKEELRKANEECHHTIVRLTRELEVARCNTLEKAAQKRA